MGKLRNYSHGIFLNVNSKAIASVYVFENLAMNQKKTRLIKKLKNLERPLSIEAFCKDWIKTGSFFILYSFIAVHRLLLDSPRIGKTSIVE